MKRILFSMIFVIICACNSPSASRSSRPIVEVIYDGTETAQLATTIPAPAASMHMVGPSVNKTTPPPRRSPQPTLDNRRVTPYVSPITEIITKTAETFYHPPKPVKPPSGNIFFWSFDHSYIQINQLADQTPNIIKYSSAKPLEDQPIELKPDYSTDLAFAAHHQKVAYTTSFLARSNEPRELWIADSDTRNAKQVWVDSTNWLGVVTDPIAMNPRSEVLWGPDDRYVLITTYLEEKASHMMIYDLDQQKEFLVTGSCGIIAFSKSSQKPEIWCKLQEDKREVYAALDTDGIQTNSQPPEQIIAESLSWKISPNGKRVVYLGDDNQWYITDSRGDSKPLSFRYNVENDNFYFTTGARNIVWSMNGEKILIFGEDGSQKYCPPQRSDYTDKTFTRPCWLVVDSNSGSVIWWPDIDMQTNYSSYNMAMSPDGEWLVVTLSRVGAGHMYTLMLINVSTKYSQKIRIDSFLLPAYHIKWCNGPQKLDTQLRVN